MITVCLHGGLKKYGRRFRLHAATPAEALRALFVQLDGLRREISDGLYQVRWRGKDCDEETARADLGQGGDGVLHIVPRVAGAGRVGQIIAGVVLLVIAYVFPVTAGYLVPAGVGLIVGGVAQFFIKQPKMDLGEGAKQSRNTAFSNLDNTAAQGRPVPVAYGRAVYCGSRVVSQGVESRRLAESADGTSSGNSARRGSRAMNWSAAREGADPTAADLTFGLKKTFVAGVAATAPNGKKYNTDFPNESVRARNYLAEYEISK